MKEKWPKQKTLLQEDKMMKQLRRQLLQNAGQKDFTRGQQCVSEMANKHFRGGGSWTEDWLKHGILKILHNTQV